MSSGIDRRQKGMQLINSQSKVLCKLLYKLVISSVSKAYMRVSVRVAVVSISTSENNSNK